MKKLATIIILLIPVWLFLVAPQFTKLPDDFSYRADVASLDNFYDPDAGNFTGAMRSVTRFTYDVVQKQRGVLLIKNVFDARTVRGDGIFAVERSYGIEPHSRKHVAGAGDKDRDGYLFAPRRIRKGQPFTYWHINYDGPARMRFAGKENLFGLPVHRYETRYEGVTIDQTRQLGHLPGVPEERGVRAEPRLQLWIEPVTGLMVKYRDDTVASYYDIATGEKLHPWNSFSNVITRESVERLADHAKRRKVAFNLVEIGVPVLLALLAAAVFVVSRKRFSTTLAAVLVGLGASSLLLLLLLPLLAPPQEDQVFVGISHWRTSSEHDRNVQGFLDALRMHGYEEGKNLSLIVGNAEGDLGRQRELARSFLRQNVDLVYSLRTQGTLATKGEITTVPIVFSGVAYPLESGIVGSLQHSGNNLVGTRNWVPAIDQLEAFVDLAPETKAIGFVRHAGEPNSRFQFEEFSRTAATKGIRVIEIGADSAEEMRLRLRERRKEFDSLYTACDSFMESRGEDVVIAFAKQEKIPMFTCFLTGVLRGNLLSVGADHYTIGRLAGEKAALILDGISPSALDTSGVIRPYLYLNRSTADALGIELPQHLLIRAKRIVQ